MTNQEYNDHVQKKAKPSPVWKDLLWAFCIGGSICTVGQGLLNVYLSYGLDKTTAGTWVSVTFVAISAVLTGLGLYHKIAKRAGAGTLVPITGFANAVVAPALEFRSEGFITGVCAKLFVIAGPVLVCGIGSSVIYGVILCLFGQ